MVWKIPILNFVYPPFPDIFLWPRNLSLPLMLWFSIWWCWHVGSFLEISVLDPLLVTYLDFYPIAQNLPLYNIFRDYACFTFCFLFFFRADITYCVPTDSLLFSHCGEWLILLLIRAKPLNSTSGLTSSWLMEKLRQTILKVFHPVVKYSAKYRASICIMKITSFI